MKEERDHRRRENYFKQLSAGLYAPIPRCDSEPDVRRPPRPPLGRIKLGRRFSAWTLVCRGDVQSDARRAATSSDRVSQVCRGLKELIIQTQASAEC